MSEGGDLFGRMSATEGPDKPAFRGLLFRRSWAPAPIPCSAFGKGSFDLIYD